jgi:CRISPR-associated protein Csm5
MKLKLHTISPVHIGSGKSLEPFEYIIDNDIYYRLDQKKAFNLALQKHPDFPDKFSKWLEDTDRKLHKTKDNAEQSRIRSNFNFKYFCEYVLQDYELSERIIKEAYSYKCDLPFGLQGKKQVNELLKEENNKIFIPGTTIKGAIRTILMWRAFNLLKDDSKVKLLNTIINSNNFRKRKVRSLDDKLNEEFFVCGKKTYANGQKIIDYSDIKFDIMRFIHISDARPIKAKMAVYPANLYITNKPPQPQTPAIETIDFNSSFEFYITVNEEEIRTLYEISMEQNADSWIDFASKFKRIFGFYPHEVENGNLEERIVESIKNSVRDFYNAIFKREKKWLSRFQYNIIERRVTAKNADIDSIKEFFDVYEEIPIMFKIGWASGFIATTIFDALEFNNSTRPLIQKIFNHFNIGIPPNRRKDPNVTPADVKKFPKSRRFTAEALKSPVDPIGWVALLDEEQNLELE